MGQGILERVVEITGPLYCRVAIELLLDLVRIDLSEQLIVVYMEVVLVVDISERD